MMCLIWLYFHFCLGFMIFFNLWVYCLEFRKISVINSSKNFLIPLSFLFCPSNVYIILLDSNPQVNEVLFVCFSFLVHLFLFVFQSDSFYCWNCHTTCFICFPSLRDHSLRYYLMSEFRCFICFVWFSSCA